MFCCRIYFTPLLSYIVFLVLAFSNNSLAQNQSYQLGQAGTTYIVAFPDTTSNISGGTSDQLDNKYYVYLYSAVNTQATIKSRLGSVQVIPLDAGQFRTVDLTNIGTTVIEESGKIVSNTFRIEANDPIIIYCYMGTAFGAEAWAPLPLEAWGIEYYLTALPGDVISNVSTSGFRIMRRLKMAPAEVLIVAAFDGTVISINPTGEFLPNQPFSVTLNAGEAYQMQSLVDTNKSSAGDLQPDISGTHISASKPISVLSGTTRTPAIFESRGITQNSFKGMVMETVTPVEQHGTEFVYMPTWDSRRLTGDINEDPVGKRVEEYFRVYGTSPGTTTASISEAVTGVATSFSVNQKGFHHYRVSGGSRAVYIKTDKPAQVTMNSTAIMDLVESIVIFNLVKEVYESYAPYMTELVPREQWVSFAPFIAPSHPGGLEHFVNVVASFESVGKIFMKSGSSPEQPFRFERGFIAGTNLVWGTVSINPGTDYYIRGDSGIQFTGTVYGVAKGLESYNPADFPARYDERLAVSYGYPLAPNRNVVGKGDSLKIESERNCANLSLNIRAQGASSVGFRTINLAKSSTNTALSFAEPSDGVVMGLGQAELLLSPVDHNLDAQATLVITDRTGKMTTVPYSYIAERVDISPASSVDMGYISVGFPPSTKTITITNPVQKDIPVNDIAFALGNKGFEIVEVTPAPGTLLKTDETMTVTLRYTPGTTARYDTDSLRIMFGCQRSTAVQITGVTQEPCITVEDVNFGTLYVNQAASRQMLIRNIRGGTVKFTDSTGSGVLTWLLSKFNVAQSQLDMLAATTLDSGQQVSVAVSFSSPDSGIFRTTARMWANTRACRDTVVWQARVLDTTSVDTTSSVDIRNTSANANRFSLQRSVPNPFSQHTEIGFTIGASGRVTLVVYDASGREVATLVDTPMSPGAYTATWDADGLPAGVYYCTMTAGQWHDTQMMVLVK